MLLVNCSPRSSPGDEKYATIGESTFISKRKNLTDHILHLAIGGDNFA